MIQTIGTLLSVYTGIRLLTMTLNETEQLMLYDLGRDRRNFAISRLALYAVGALMTGMLLLTLLQGQEIPFNS